MKFLHRRKVVFLCGCLVLAGVANGFASPIATPASQPAPQAVEQSPEQLHQLVAPIALYPDPLVAQILAAATYPAQVIEANQWMQQHQGLTGDALAKEVDKQSWDPSVKALTEFPAVLANMSQNLAWTAELGDAYINQHQELTQTIQNMRHLAKEAGNLRSSSQENVTTDGDAIDIEPTSTDDVYVPEYDPWLVYGDLLPVFTGWDPYPGLYLDGPGIAFGLGLGIGWFGGYGWGWNNWGCDWRQGTVVYNHQPFVSHSRTIVDRNSPRPVGHGLVDHGFHSGRFAAHAGSHVTHSSHLAMARNFHSLGLSHYGAHAYFHSGGFHGFHGGGFTVEGFTEAGSMAEGTGATDKG
jgi:hypothetical protein